MHYLVSDFFHSIICLWNAFILLWIMVNFFILSTRLHSIVSLYHSLSICVVFRLFWSLWIALLLNILEHVCVNTHAFLLGIYIGIELQSSLIITFSCIWGWNLALWNSFEEKKYKLYFWYLKYCSKINIKATITTGCKEKAFYCPNTFQKAESLFCNQICILAKKAIIGSPACF